MGLALLSLILCATAINLALLVRMLSRASTASQALGSDLRNELRSGRDEARGVGKELREEVSGRLATLDDFVRHELESHGAAQQNHYEAMAGQLRTLADASRSAVDELRTLLDTRLKELQGGNEKKLGDIRGEVAAGLKSNAESVTSSLERLGNAQQAQLVEMTRQVKQLSESNQSTLDRIRETLDARVKDLQDGNEKTSHELRQDVTAHLRESGETQAKAFETASRLQSDQLSAMRTEQKEIAAVTCNGLEAIRSGLDSRVKELLASNEQKLEEMRQTVDEKLHDTLEKRLGESFRLVSERLDSVHKGLGEMQGLAVGVGDLKRVLTNVKTRGNWAEVQLGAILEQFLVAEQWQRNVCVKPGTAERVEYAIRLPGPKEDRSAALWLPIDSKFPQEDFLRLQLAAEQGEPALVQAAQEGLLRTLRTAAKDIHEKYINPPYTTDFAIMFLATEGLYGEVVRQPGLVEDLQNRYHVIVAGPTNLAALLTSLRVGFQTLAIEQRATEVWRILGAVKTEFAKFGAVLDKVHRQLHTASKTIEETGARTRVMQRKLRAVEELSPAETSGVLALPAPNDDAQTDEAEAPFAPALSLVPPTLLPQTGGVA